MTALTFTIPGPPRPKQRPHLGKGGRVYTPGRTLAYERQVAVSCLVARQAAGIGPRPLGPIEVACEFFLPTAQRADVDNLVKATLDGMNGVAYDDDSQVVRVTVSKAIDRVDPRTMVTVVYHSENLGS